MKINLIKLLRGLQLAGVNTSQAATIISLSTDSTSQEELLQAVGKCYHEACDKGLTGSRGYLNNVIVELGHPKYYQGNQPADSNKGTLPYCHGWQY